MMMMMMMMMMVMMMIIISLQSVLNVIVWGSIPGAKNYGPPIWLKHLAQKLGAMRDFKSQFGSLLWRLVFELQGVSLLALKAPRTQSSKGHFESAIKLNG